MLSWKQKGPARPALFLPDGRLVIGLEDALSVRAAPDFEKEVARWKVAVAPSALALGPDGTQLHVEVDSHFPPLSDASGTKVIVLDVKTGKVVPKAGGALHFIDAATGLRNDGKAVTVFELSSGQALCRYVTDREVHAVASPISGAVVLTTDAGESGPTEVLQLRRPGRANSPVKAAATSP